MPVYRRSGGTVARAHLRVRVGGSTMGAGRRLRTPLVDPPPVPTGTMTYTAEPLGAGGWVTGNVISPDGLTRLGRTDTMGAWRWSSAADAWVSTTNADTLPAAVNSLDTAEGVQAIIAANDVAFMAYKNAIYKSTDRGVTWTASVASGITTAPNMGNQRWWGQRMAFDAADSNICIYGTLNAGLWYTLNKGTTWTQVPAGTLPFGSDGAATPGKETFGINAVAVTPDGNWWAAPYGSGVYRSTDHGTTWTQVSAGNFIATCYLRGGPNNDIMATTHNTLTRTDQAQVWRYRGGTWTNVKPAVNQGWRSIAYDPTTPGRVMVMAEGAYQAVSLDYGTTWAAPPMTMNSDTDIPWLGAANGFGTTAFVTLGELNFDPVVTSRVWLSQGIGVWYADLPTSTSATIPWHAQSRGIEQLVVNDVVAPPGGLPVVISWDRALFLAGESSSLPVVTVPTPPSTPVTTPASLAATLVSGFPKDFTYAWTVLSKPGGSTAGAASFGFTTALQTVFTPDVTGSYTLRLTSTNGAGVSTTDVPVTAIAKVTSLILPGTTGNYVSTPAASQLDLTGSLTLEAKLSLPDWAPTAKIPIMGKYGASSRSYALALDNTGLLGFIATNSIGSTGSFNVPSGALSFPPGSMQWVRMVYDATAMNLTFYTSPDGVTWTAVKTVTTSNGAASNPVAVSTAPLTVGSTGNLSTYTNGRIYRARVLDATGTAVADFNAEGITRTATRTPTTYTGAAGLTWTPQGAGWDWS